MHLFKLYFIITRLRLKIALYCKADFLVSVLGTLVGQAVMLFILSAIYSRVDELNGFTK